MKPFVFEIDITPETAFAALAGRPYALWLDSADRTHARGRYSYVLAHPVEIIEMKGNNAFRILKEKLGQYKSEIISGLPPFQGGAAGFFSYDLGRSLEALPDLHEDQGIPDVAVGIYDAVAAFDHAQNKAWLIVRAKDEEEGRKKKEDFLQTKSSLFPLPSSNIQWTPAFSKDKYLQRIKKAIAYIRAGDIFQANLSQRFEADLPSGFDPFAHYMNLREINPAPFAAYMNFGDFKISSASPEQFLSVRGKHIETKPIKGTRPRSADPQELLSSAKDRAENIMIVDLLRNDLSKVCEPDSVEVEKLCALESFASVHHLVSTIKGRLRDGQTALDALRACFPGGSITGAPKIRAMEIIEELEAACRGPYCGAAGWISFDGAMEMNILIRTLVYNGDKVSLNSGGGITADSDPEEEYQETITKAEAMFRSFGNKKARAA